MLARRREAELALERVEEGRRRCRRQVLDTRRGGLVEHGPVLGDHQVERFDLRTDGKQVVEVPPGDEQQAPARGARAAERGERFRRDPPVERQGAVVVAGEHVEAHRGVRYQRAAEAQSVAQSQRNTASAFSRR